MTATRWFYEDVAGRLFSPATERPVKVTTITQYVYVRHKHIREGGGPRPGDIPEPDGYTVPARGGHLRPYWHPATITPWLDARQPPGQPRKDHKPRQWRKTSPRKTGPVPRQVRAGLRPGPARDTDTD